MKTAWLAEVPARTASLPLYRSLVPRREGKLDETLVLVTADANAALQFTTREECEAWCAANPEPRFVPREHGFMDGGGVDANGSPVGA